MIISSLVAPVRLSSNFSTYLEDSPSDHLAQKKPEEPRESNVPIRDGSWT